MTLDRDLRLRTAEHVGISFELAGIGNRVLATFVDVVLVGTVVLGFGLVASVAMASAGSRLSPTLASIVVALLLVFLGLVLPLSYWILLEAFWNGQTLGKRLVGIRVLRDDGGPPGFFAIAARAILRVLDIVPFLLAIDLVAMVISAKGQRLGDLVAGTVVVKARIARDFASLRTRAPTVASDVTVRGLSGEAQRLVREFALRSATLAPAARADVARAIATAVRPLVPESAEHPDDVDLLQHLAAAMRDAGDASAPR